MNKKQNGVTLIQMVITIVMIAIIATFAVFNSRDTVIETKVSKVYDEMIKVREAVIGVMTLSGDLTGVGESVSDLSGYPNLTPYYNTSEHEYYLLDFKGKKDVLENALELRNIENNYIVNVKRLDNIEILLVDGIDVRGTMCYSYGEILSKYNDVFSGR